MLFNNDYGRAGGPGRQTTGKELNCGTRQSIKLYY